MAIEAQAGRRDARARGPLDGVVAVAAVDPVVGDVVSVVELERLLDRLALPGEQRAAHPQHAAGDRAREQPADREQRDLRDRVAPDREEGAHGPWWCAESGRSEGERLLRGVRGVL